MRADLTQREPRFVDQTARSTGVDEVEPGVLHLAVPFDSNWKLRVDGVEVEARRAFGVTTAFDLAVAGSAELRYDSPQSRSLFVALQVVLWLVVLFGATRVSVSIARRRGLQVTDETLISLDALPPPASIDPGLEPVAVAAPSEAPDLADDEPDQHEEPS